jgi:PiT family inorganic phosphate transporter
VVLAVAGLAVLLAWANGANDVSKGIATLVGSGVANRRAAVLWGAFWTFAGSVAAAFASQALVATFSGAGLLAAPVAGPAFLAAVSLGALLWVAFASRTGLPVSTTHAIAGALAGTGIAAQGATSLHWAFLARRVALPLALSPVVSILLVSALYPLLRRGVTRFETYCLCIERRDFVMAAGAGLAMTSASSTSISSVPSAVVAPVAECETAPAITARLSAVDALHWLSAAATSFARGLNDTPKIVALGVGATAVFGVPPAWLYVAIALAMAGGGLIAGFRVVETLACRVTNMTPGEGFAANVVTTVLVGAASVVALPVSTTHVSSGAIIGIGLHHGSAIQWRTVREMALAWLVTLPIAALMGGLAFLLLSRA